MAPTWAWAPVALVVLGCGCERGGREPGRRRASPPAQALPLHGEIPATSASPEAQARYREARALLDSDLGSAAARALEQAVQADPEMALAHAYLGSLLDDERRYVHIRKARELLPGLPEAERLLAEWLVAQTPGPDLVAGGRKELLGRLIAAAPDDFRGHAALGMEHYKDRQLAEAATAFARAAALNPAANEVTGMLGRSLSRLRRFEEAIPVLTRWSERVTSTPLPLNHLGTALLATGRFAEAEEVLAKVAERHEYWQGHTGVAYSRFFRGDYAGGREALVRARASAGSAAARLSTDTMLAWSYLAEGDQAEALKAIDAREDASKRMKEDGFFGFHCSATLQRAFVFNEAGRHEEALGQLLENEERCQRGKLPPSRVAVLQRQSLIPRLYAQARLGRLQEAEATLRRMEEGPSRRPATEFGANARFGRGLLLWAKKDLAGAAAELGGCGEEAMYCRTKLAAVQEQHGQRQAAIATWTQILSANRREMSYLYMRERARAALQRLSPVPRGRRR